MWINEEGKRCFIIQVVLIFLIESRLLLAKITMIIINKENTINRLLFIMPVESR